MSSGDPREEDGSASPERSTSGPVRKRKQRQPLSCAECRRLKLKCDRDIPCANCIRRECDHLCPDGARLPNKANIEETNELKARLEKLENLLSGYVAMQDGDNRSRGPGPMVPPPGKRARVDDLSTTSVVSASQQPSISPRMNIQQSGLESSIAVPSRRTVDHVQAESTFDMSTMLEQPLVFDFDTSPQTNIQHSQRVQTFTTTTNPGLERLGPETSPQDLGHGTLVMSKSGAASRYFGHTAASEWLKDQEFNDFGDPASPRPSRLPSPDRSGGGGVFPFSTRGAATSTAVLLSGLPDIYEARVLIDSYFRYFAWHFDVAPRSTIDKILIEIYSVKNATAPNHGTIESQNLALLFIILAMGSLHNLELPPNDPSADEYLDWSKRSLSKSDFMTNSTIAGIQTLHIMAHYHLATEKGRNGDSAWPLWGMAMRLLQAMGLHRDGTKWNLDHDTVEARRRVLWESYSADVFQANCFSRPSSIAPQYIDTAFPTDPSDPGADPTLRHDTLKFALSKISAQVLDHAMRIDAPPYASVRALHDKLVQFERDIPYGLRCRTVLLALPSMYPDPESALRESPELTRKDLRKTLQQFALALNVSETLLFLHRPYFARALHERKPDPTQTEFGQSYLCVVERCNVMIQICAAIYPLHPGVISRHWFFWYHVFNAAVCMGTLVLKDPRNMLASYALSLIDSAIGLYTNIIQSHSTTRLLRNLEWLLKLRQRASSRIASVSTIQPDNVAQTSDDEDDAELIGWRTRLVQRLGKGTQLATTITPSQSVATPSPNTAMAQTISQALQKHFVPDEASQALPPNTNEVMLTTDQGTDMLLHQFWDPMMLQDQPSSSGDPLASIDWWNWDSSGDQDGGV